MRARYFEGINAELSRLEHDRQLFYGMVNKITNEIFETAYLERLDMVYEKSKEAQSLDKRRMFIRFKKFLMKSRLLAYLGEETARLTQQIQALPFKQIHLSEDWDKSHRDQDHPELRQSVMWHLSKAINKSTLAPPELIRTYLTDPEAAKSLQAYTFDKDELEKLRKDILMDPGKYEEVLLKQPEHDPFYDRRDPGGWLASMEARAWKKDYQYRLINDGDTGLLENWPMRVEFHAYRVWAESI